MDLSQSHRCSPTVCQALRDCLSLLTSHRLSRPSLSRELDQVELRLLWLVRELSPSDFLVSDQLRVHSLQVNLVEQRLQLPQH
jgi:hypothetical protein